MGAVAIVPTEVITSSILLLRGGLDELEERYDEQFEAVWEAIRELMTPPSGPRRPLGFAVATES